MPRPVRASNSARLANASVTIGLIPGALSGAYGYRGELRSQRSRLVRLGSASLLGGVTGALVLMVLPAAAFATVVPALLLVASAAIVLQPRLASLRHRHHPVGHGDLFGWLGICAVGVFGGYFGAAQGVLAIAVMGMVTPDTIHRLNAARNMLSLLVYVAAAGVFLATGAVAWSASGLIAAGSVVGGALGARIALALPPGVLRGLLVAVATVAALMVIVRFEDIAG